MRLVSFVRDGVVYAGVLDGSDVIEAGEGGVGVLLRQAQLPAAAPSGSSVPLSSVQLLAPVPQPGKIICLGLNYRSHADEAGMEAPGVPTFFAKWANALAAPGAAVALPAWSSKVDYEAEVAFVIGRRCRDVAEADALDVIAGYTLLNDLSARDYQFKTPQWMPGKVFDGSAPCGPALVTPDEAGPPDGIEISLTLNGEVMQSASTADLIHSIPSVVAYLSQLMTLEPGDIVSTGTPAGVGSTRDPRVWLKPGDEVVVESPTLGRLETRLT
jgi:2-keto-4-pentenoate hydratase/2-oxohepta-3-ene-1,7-dioic acid hydratase in catechol pathway